MTLASLGDNITGGGIVKTEEKTTRKNEAFWEGFRAGLFVIGGIVGILLLIFWL